MIAAVEDQRTRVESLFADFKEGTSQAIPARPEGGDVPALMTCYENLFRDWVWGDKEAEATRSIVARLIRGPLGRLAVFGAGAGRLAVDIHQTLRPAETLALDVNPLPLLVAQRLVRGETVDLPEFPVAPHSGDQVVMQRSLRCPGPLREGFTFLFADALRPPFAPASLDTVVTCWFIDAAGADLRETAAVINRVLRPGGQWINLGPLRFKETISRSYTIEEVWDIVAQSAFELGAREREDVPYFDSPASGSRRIETVFSFAASKTGEASTVIARDTVAPWIADATLPIPRTPTMMNLGRTSLFTAGAMSLVDGVRSMSDVANEIAKSTGIAPANLLGQLRAFFAKLPPG
ncbi:MAG TPA: methyltransferase domain-containing protein [Polyangiaceae bacterium]|nr:methyltransferase domain-containing protein [Polyangiaceae bacterium]